MPRSRRAQELLQKQFEVAKADAAKVIAELRRAGGADFDNPGENEARTDYNALVAGGPEGYQHFRNTGRWPPSNSDAADDAGSRPPSLLSATRTRRHRQQ